MRALDHLVFGVDDLTEAAEDFEAMGFQVGPVNRHPWGTENRIVQFADETFLELIAVADSGAIPPHAGRRVSFGAFVRDGIGYGTGVSMLVLKSGDADADAAAFKAGGMGDFDVFAFSRKGVGPEGGPVDVAFRLAFAHDPLAPRCGFFTCQQLFPENFWSRARQVHPNGASGISRVTMVAENPSDHHIFLSAFVGRRELRATSFGIEAEAGAGLVEIVSPEGFAFRYGVPPPAFQGARFAGLTFRNARPPALAVALAPTGRAVPPRMHRQNALLFEGV